MPLTINITLLLRFCGFGGQESKVGNLVCGTETPLGFCAVREAIKIVKTHYSASQQCISSNSKDATFCVSSIKEIK